MTPFALPKVWTALALAGSVGGERSPTEAVPAAHEASVEEAWARYRVGAWTEASALAARALEQDASHVGWQRVHSRSRARIDGDRAIVAQHRAWLDSGPVDARDPIRRIVLADALLSAWRFDPAWCDEIAALLSGSPAREDARIWSTWLAREAATTRCGTDASPPTVDEVASLASDGVASGVEGVRALVVRLAMEGGIDAVEAGRIEAALSEEPALLGRMVGLFAEERAAPPRSLQRLVVQRAVDVVASWSDSPPEPPPSVDDLAALADAFVVLDAWNDARGRPGIVRSIPRGRTALDQADQLLESHHPDPHRFGDARRISRARRVADPAVALERVDALSGSLRDTPEIQARFHTARGDLQRSLGDLDAATESYRHAWTRTPTHPDRANWFAYHTILLDSPGPDALEEARVAATAAVQGFRAARFSDRDWPGETYPEWKARSARRVAEALDTRGWTLHRLGRNAEAVPDLLEAVRVLDNPTVELHLGLVLAALGERDAAAVHLARGVRERDPAEAATVEAGWAALRRWWPDAAIWHPGGLQGWVAQVVGEPGEAPPEPPSLVGGPLPGVDVVVDGGVLGLDSIEGPAVVDVWATWCRPCVQALPKLQSLADDHPDVRFLAVAVDEQQDAVDAFFAGQEAGALGLAWWSSTSSPYETLKIGGVPSVFVLDDQSRVVSVLFGSDVDRLASWVNTVDGDATSDEEKGRPGSGGP